MMAKQPTSTEVDDVTKFMEGANEQTVEVYQLGSGDAETERSSFRGGLGPPSGSQASPGYRVKTSSHKQANEHKNR